jgi:hypothetical protein
MKIEKLFGIHLVVMVLVFGYYVLFPEQANELMKHFMLAKLTAVDDPVQALRTLLFLASTTLILLLTPVICRRGICGANVPYIQRFTWLGLMSTNLFFGLGWAVLLLLPLQPPVWMNHSVFYVLAYLTVGSAIQILVQMNAYKLNLTKAVG